MPRIRPFTDFELEPAASPAAAPPAPVQAEPAASAEAPEPASRSARHSTGEGEQPPGHAVGGRRRRSAGDGDGEGHDMLARILEREGAQ
jgi:hypothetical protein